MTDTQESLFFLLPPLEGGTKGGFQQRDFSGFIRGSLFLPLIVHPHPNPLPSREREKEFRERGKIHRWFPPIVDRGIQE